MIRRTATAARRLAPLWPWALLAMAAGVAAWCFWDFSEDLDGEFPRVVRPTFCPRPPLAYRMAEPGETLDRIGLYAAAAAVVLAAGGWNRARRSTGGARLWPSALGLALAAFWCAANPRPTFDGWHGLGWPAMLDPSAPLPLRLALAVAAAALAGLVVRPLGTLLRDRADLLRRGRAARCLALLATAAVLIGLRAAGVPDVEPVGYWPRWAFGMGMIAFAAALVRAMPPRAVPARPAWIAARVLAAWAVVAAVGLGCTLYTRPLSRLRAVVPGRLYISAMPSYLGLQIEQRRLHFKTIINLFPEDTSLRSPRLPEEYRFVREHGIHYLRSPVGASNSDAFLDRTLALAQDPDAWPVLVHCHGCRDRTPAWVGIYRFVVEGRPLDEALRELERHRGDRPKASVTLLYNRVLPPRAPRRHASDPTAQLLRRCAEGVVDPFYEAVRREQAGAIDGRFPELSEAPEPPRARR